MCRPTISVRPVALDRLGAGVPGLDVAPDVQHEDRVVLHALDQEPVALLGGLLLPRRLGRWGSLGSGISMQAHVRLHLVHRGDPGRYRCSGVDRTSSRHRAGIGRAQVENRTGGGLFPGVHANTDPLPRSASRGDVEVKTPERPCKPSFVPPPFEDGDEHSSRALVAQGPRQRATREQDGPSLSSCEDAPLLALASGGVCRAAHVTVRAVRSYRTVSPLPPPVRAEAVCFLWHFPAGRPDWPLASTLPCEARTFLPSPMTAATSVRPGRSGGSPYNLSVQRPQKAISYAR